MVNHKHTILIIEDDQSYRRSLRANLRNQYRIFDCESGEEGVKIIQKETIDVCLLDYILPQMRGDEVIPLIREIKPEMPIVFMTAFPDWDLKTKVEDEMKGTQIFVTKPTNNEYLKEIIDICVSGKMNERKQHEVKFRKNSGKKKKDNSEKVPKSRRLIDIVMLAKEEPDKWDAGKLSVRFGCTPKRIYKDIDEIREGGIKIERINNGYSILE